MTLYAANLMDIATPVEKKGKKTKAEKKTEEAVAPAVEKKPLSEKRLAALAKAQETRKRKREEAATAKAAEEDAIKSKEAEIKAKEEEIARKKEAMKEKRRLKREEKKQEQTPPASEASSSSEPAEEGEAPKPKKVRKQKQPRDENIPPAWFQKYVEGVKQEEAKQGQTKVSKKQVEQEARETATQQWKDGFTRDRVQNEVDSHMSRMYGMIFHNRKMK